MEVIAAPGAINMAALPGSRREVDRCTKVWALRARLASLIYPDVEVKGVSMKTIVVTRMGFGRILVYPTRPAAEDSALTQYGDAVLQSERDVLNQYTPLEWPAIAVHLGHPQLGVEFIERWTALQKDRRAREAYREECSRRLWELLQEQAVPPPDNPEMIVRIASEDRRAVRIEDPRTSVERRAKMAKRNKTAETTENAEATTATETKTPTSKIDTTRIVRLALDKDGKQYGVENNPKRAGSASHARFASYTDGMTVGQALEAGITAADLAHDQKKGFIVLEGGESTEEQAAA